MEDAAVFEKVKKNIVEQFDVNEKDVTPEAKLVDDLGADSLALIDLRMALEKEFNEEGFDIEVLKEDFKELITVQDIVNFIKRCTEECLTYSI